MRWFVVASLPLVAVLASCDDELFGEVAVGYSACDRDPPLTYDNFGRGFLGKHCTGCHSSLWLGEEREGAPLDINFDTWAGVLGWADEIHHVAVASQVMPPSGGTKSEEREILGEWLSCDVIPSARDAEEAGLLGGE